MPEPEPTALTVHHLPRPLDPEVALVELNKLASTLKDALTVPSLSSPSFNMLRDELLETSKAIRHRQLDPAARGLIYVTGFRAATPSGETVSGAVGSGWLKGSTIRFD